MQPSLILLSNYYFLNLILYGCGGNTGAGLVICKPFQKTVQGITHIKHITKQAIEFKGKYTQNAWIGITIKGFTICVYEIIYRGNYQPLTTCKSMIHVLLQIFMFYYRFSQSVNIFKGNTLP
jgi:hypothetical protein